MRSCLVPRVENVEISRIAFLPPWATAADVVSNVQKAEGVGEGSNGFVVTERGEESHVP